MRTAFRKPPLAILGDADPGSDAFERAAGGQVPSVIPEGSMPPADWPATVVVPCGMGDARNLIMALAGDACIVSGGRACTISEVWLRSEEHTSELQSQSNLVCRLLLEKKKT